MIFSKPVEPTTNATDPGIRASDDVKRSTQRGADGGAVQELRQQTPPLLERVGEQASALAQRGVDAVRDRSLQVRDQAQRASDSTLNYIKDEPVKAVLIAAATGAALMALVGLLRRPA